MFERFTEKARTVVTYAHDEARAFRHNYIGTEHILLGLLSEPDGLAGKVLRLLDITHEEVHLQVARIVGNGEEEVSGQIPFTPRAKKVLELALREALSLGHNYIGTEHVLLGLVRENEGVAARILLDFDADAEKVRNEIIRQLSGARRVKEAEASSEDKLSPDAVGLLQQVHVLTSQLPKQDDESDEDYRTRLQVVLDRLLLPREGGPDVDAPEPEASRVLNGADILRLAVQMIDAASGLLESAWRHLPPLAAGSTCSYESLLEHVRDNLGVIANDVEEGRL